METKLFSVCSCKLCPNERIRNRGYQKWNLYRCVMSPFCCLSPLSSVLCFAGWKPTWSNRNMARRHTGFIPPVWCQNCVKDYSGQAIVLLLCSSEKKSILVSELSVMPVPEGWPYLREVTAVTQGCILSSLPRTHILAQFPIRFAPAPYASEHLCDLLYLVSIKEHYGNSKMVGYVNYD